MGQIDSPVDMQIALRHMRQRRDHYRRMGAQKLAEAYERWIREAEAEVATMGCGPRSEEAESLRATSASDGAGSTAQCQASATPSAEYGATTNINHTMASVTCGGSHDSNGQSAR